MTEDPKNTNIVWHQAQITQADRETLAGHKGAVLWFTGLSGVRKIDHRERRGSRPS